MTLFQEYADLNEQLLRCILRSETKAANIIRAEMDGRWKMLSLTEQELMKKKLEAPTSK